MHLVDKHMYPKNFFFAITREGIDGRRSLLLEGRTRRRRSSAATVSSRPQSSQSQEQEPLAAEEPTETTKERPVSDSGRENPEQQPDQEMADLTSAMSSLQFVPMSVRFGRGRRAGFSKR